MNLCWHSPLRHNQKPMSRKYIVLLLHGLRHQAIAWTYVDTVPYDTTRSQWVVNISCYCYTGFNWTVIDSNPSAIYTLGVWGRLFLYQDGTFHTDKVDLYDNSDLSTFAPSFNGLDLVTWPRISINCLPVIRLMIGQVENLIAIKHLQRSRIFHPGWLSHLK